MTEPRSLPRLLLPGAIGAVVAAGAVQLLRAVRGLPDAMGAGPAALVAHSRAEAGPVAVYDGRTFRNRMPSVVLTAGSAPALAKGLLQHGDRGKPGAAVPVLDTRPPASAAGLAVTWLGHASALIEVDGHFVLADPIVEERVSPSPLVGPQRMHRAPLRLTDLPDLTAVIISHDHYDHLEAGTVRRLVDLSDAPFLAPLGIGAHLAKWGVPAERIVELDWNGRVQVAGLTLTCTEARHFSGRGLTRNTTLWSSWAIAGPEHRVYFGGDTGYTPAFAEIGARLGPFDLTLLPVGAYGPQWPDIHMDPEEAWRAHGDLGGRLLVPIHWGTFDLALHTWTEPIDRLLAAARGDLRILIPRPGERLELDGPPPARTDWWSALRRADIRSPAAAPTAGVDARTPADGG